MKTIRSLSAALALAGLFGVVGAGAADANESAPANANCRQETKRVAVWPRTPPKAPSMARFEERQVTVCDSKVASKQSADEQLQAKDGDN
jgi:Flp pilus assembly protein CpaB